MAQFTRTSVVSGVTRTLEIPSTQEAWEQHKRDRTLIQQTFPGLTADQREFLMTGMLPEEWDAMFAGEEE